MLGLWPSHAGAVQTGPSKACLLPRLFRKAPAATVLIRYGSRAFEPLSVRAPNPPCGWRGACLSFFAAGGGVGRSLIHAGPSLRYFTRKCRLACAGAVARN